MCTFADVKAEDKLQLALIRIAQLEDELKAQTSRPDWTAREKELNDRHAFETVLQNGDVELSNNICEQMMRHIKMNLKNSMNIGSEDSALDYAFMFSALESCDINHLAPETYLRKLILGLHEKKVEKKQLLPCYIGL